MPTNFQRKQALCEKFKKQLRKRPTEAELIFESKLKQLHICFMSQKGFIKDPGFYIVDFYLPRPRKLCIEIDGAYHKLDEQLKRDKQKDDYLIKERNFKVLRLTNEEAIDISLSDLKQLLETKAVAY